MDLQQSRTEQSLSALNWRAMTEADLDGVVQVALKSFPDHPEERYCFANRLDLNPKGCFVLTDHEGTVKGYLVAYPWQRYMAPALNTLIEALPGDTGSYYLHDLAIDPEARGGGHTRTIVENLARFVKDAGYQRVSLVAVNNASGFWERNGFVVQAPEGIAEKLASYGDDARYMERELV